MNEIETFGRISLVNADCLEVMATLPDNAFDLAIVDPPYGIGIDGQKACICKNPKHNRKHHDTKGWDKLPPPFILLNCNVLAKIKSFGAQITLFRCLTKAQKVGLCGSRVKPGLQCRIANWLILHSIARPVLSPSTDVNLQNNIQSTRPKSQNRFMGGCSTITQSRAIRFLTRTWGRGRYALPRITSTLRCWESNLMPGIIKPRNNVFCITNNN